jgi:hypothetical protein
VNRPHKNQLGRDMGHIRQDAKNVPYRHGVELDRGLVVSDRGEAEDGNEGSEHVR